MLDKNKDKKISIEELKALTQEEMKVASHLIPNMMSEDDDGEQGDEVEDDQNETEKKNIEL